MPSQAQKKQPALQAEPWRYAYVSRPLLWCLSAWGAAVAAWMNDVPTIWLALTATLVAALAPVVATALAEPLRGRWLHFSLWATLGAYITFYAATGPFTLSAFAAWIPGGSILGAWWWWVRTLADDQQRAELDAQVLAEKAADRRQWPELLAQIGVKDVTEPKSARTEFGAGETTRLRLPVNGKVTYDRLVQVTGQLEIAVDARKGSLLFEEVPERAREVLLHDFTTDVLTETVPLPFDRGPKSIHNAMPLGRYATGEVCVVTFREIAALMVGLRGSGKSGLINTHLAHLTGCIDAVVWMIDLKGGRTVRPWIEPFLQETTRRPAVDWAAVTEDEADAVLIAVNAAIRSRAKGFGEKIVPHSTKPAIVLIVEEASLVTGVGKYSNTDRAGRLQDAVNTGRSEGVDCLICSQRATVTMIGNGDMKSNLDHRYGLGVKGADEARMVFPDGNVAQTLARIPVDRAHRGTFLMQSGEDARVMPAKGYWTDPELVPGMAVTNASYRPDVDDETVQAIEQALFKAGVSGGYGGRWERLRETLGYDPAGTPGTVDAGTAGNVPEQPVERPTETVRGTAAGSRGAQVVADAIAAGRAERDRSRFDDIMANSWNAEAPDEIPTEERDDGEQIPAIIRHLVQIFGDSPQLPTQFILDSFPGDGMSAKAFSLLMGHCSIAPVENVKDSAGNRVRGYARGDIYRAVDRARRGDMPARAFDWQP